MGQGCVTICHASVPTTQGCALLLVRFGIAVETHVGDDAADVQHVRRGLAEPGRLSAGRTLAG
jgi:hypothetical protein